MRKLDAAIGELADYEAALRSATSDLAPNVVEAMVEDLRAHAAELAANEPEVPLSERLGSPADFANEYRQAAADEPPRQDSVAWVEAGWRRWLFPFGILCYAAGVFAFTAALVTTGNEGYQLPSGALALAGVLLALSGRQGWNTPAVLDWRTWPADARLAYTMVWALRGWGAVVFVDAFFVGGEYLYPQLTGFPLPQYFGLGLGVFDGGGGGGLTVILATVLLSVWLGLGEHRLGKWRALVFPVDLVLAAAPVLAWISVVLHGI